jgi:RHS repeat-associated protein
MFTITDNNDIETLQSNHYYPFGMRFNQSAAYASTENRYLYNGKELQEDLGLDWYDYGARFYDPAIGRFSTVDPFAEDYSFQTPYAYAANNPITYIDLFGLYPDFPFADGSENCPDLNSGYYSYVDSYGNSFFTYGNYSYNYDFYSFDYFPSSIPIMSSGIEGNVLTIEQNQMAVYENGIGPISIRNTKVGGDVASSGGDGSKLAAVSVAFTIDLTVPELSDAAWPKWIGWAAAFAGAAIYDYVYKPNGRLDNGKLTYTIPAPGTFPYDHQPRKPEFNPGDYEKIVKWAAGLTLGARFLQKMSETPQIPNYTTPADATYVAPPRVKPLHPDLP